VSSLPRREGSQEPGLDRHEWEGVWASIEDDLRDSPDAAVSQLADLVEDMLGARGFAVNDPVESLGDEAEIVHTYRSARQTAERAELGEASREDVEQAIDDLRSLYDTLLAERAEP
jgi:hypothetical protein